MINFLEYASVAAHVYKPETQAILNINFYTLDTKTLLNESLLSKANGWYRLTDVDPNLNTVNLPHHFYAQLYVKFEKGQARDAVVAIRGTVMSDWNNMGVDVSSWWSDVLGDGGLDRLPSYMQQAMSFYNRSEKYLRHYLPGVRIFAVTGHSLGGAIAQLLPLQAAYPVFAVCFNSPGCGDIPGADKGRSGWVYNVNAVSDFVSKVGVPVGSLYLVDVLKSEPEAQAIYQHFDYQRLATSHKELAEAHASHNLIIKAQEMDMAYGNSLLAYLESLKTVPEQEPDLYLHYIKCGLQNKIEFWKEASKIQDNCGIKAILMEYPNVIMDQHSIDNMVAALKQEQNAPLAYANVV